jgi:lactoylglutathione lyase
MMLQSAFPIITTPDLPRILAFYRDLLGGVVSFAFPAEGDPVYVGIEVGTSHLGVGHDPAVADDRSPQRFALWVYVDDCDAAVELLREGGAPVVEEAADQPWGERVARVHDPDGNIVILGSRAD